MLALSLGLVVVGWLAVAGCGAREPHSCARRTSNNSHQARCVLIKVHPPPPPKVTYVVGACRAQGEREPLHVSFTGRAATVQALPAAMAKQAAPAPLSPLSFLFLIWPPHQSCRSRCCQRRPDPAAGSRSSHTQSRPPAPRHQCHFTTWQADECVPLPINPSCKCAAGARLLCKACHRRQDVTPSCFLLPLHKPPQPTTGQPWPSQVIPLIGS